MSVISWMFYLKRSASAGPELTLQP